MCQGKRRKEQTDGRKVAEHDHGQRWCYSHVALCVFACVLLLPAGRVVCCLVFDSSDCADRDCENDERRDVIWLCAFDFFDLWPVRHGRCYEMSLVIVSHRPAVSTQQETIPATAVGFL